MNLFILIILLLRNTIQPQTYSINKAYIITNAKGEEINETHQYWLAGQNPFQS